MVTERTSLPLRTSDDRGGRNIILDGLKDDRWSILVGPDAERLDELARQSPGRAYNINFVESDARELGWRMRPLTFKQRYRS